MTMDIDFGSPLPMAPPSPTDKLRHPAPTPPADLRDPAHSQYRAIRDQLWARLLQEPDNPALYERLAAVQAALGDTVDAELSRRVAAYLTRRHGDPADPDDQQTH